MNNQLSKTPPVPGSLAQQATDNHISLAETFVNADVIVIVDTSGSMGASDGTERTRYARACDELRKIQASMPGKIAVLSFSDEVKFFPSGIPANFGQGTDLAKALKFAKIADVPEMKFIVISDGEPNDEQEALAEAAKFKNHIDTIYIGPAGEPGEKFLKLLASKSGGRSAKDFAGHKLEATIRGLLA
jgi:Mg-chelatase subunit ChlD